ncbi:MAG: hypothetical protein ACLUP2_06210 [Lachnospiraceae bacterium]
MKLKKLFGKILGAGLCLGMILGLMPSQALQVKAADEHKHCVCGAMHKDVGDHTSETEITFTAWKKTDSLPDTAGNYYLENDVVISAPTKDEDSRYVGWQVPDDVVLCLNGHSITMTGREQCNAIFISWDKKFTLTDCKNTGKVTHADKEDGKKYTGSAIGVNGGTFNMYGGSITGNDATSDNPSDGRNCGGGVYLGAGNFKMYGGSITNNHSASEGGGVYISTQWDCDFYMYGGNITGNITEEEGGGVYAVSDMTVSGNVNITGNKRADNSVSNVGLYTTGKGETKTIKIDGDINGTIGVYTDRVVPTAEKPVVVVQGATANKDYSNIITSDSSNYKIMRDSSDSTKLVLTGKDAPEPTPTEHTHCVCGTNNLNTKGHSCNKNQVWTGIDDLSEITAGGYYYLKQDVTITSTNTYSSVYTSGNQYCGLKISGDVALCLNGHSIIMQNPEGVTDDVDAVMVEGHFALTDCQGMGTIKHAKDSSSATYQGKGVKVQGGTFDMYGGTITGNTSEYDTGGSGVSVVGVEDRNKSSIFNMYGGTISGNIAKNGGGVEVTRSVYNGPSEFHMYGGTITGNTADSTWSSYGNGGGVYVSWTAKFFMNGGKICGNTATYQGGGVYGSALARYNEYDTGGAAELNVSGSATVTDNKAGGKNNNVFMTSSTQKSGYETLYVKLDISDPFSGIIGVSTKDIPVTGKPVVVAAGATPEVDYSKHIVSDDTQYKIRHEGNMLMLTTADEPNHQHTWDAGKITKQPTTSEEGVKTYTCTACGATKTEPIEKLVSNTYKIIDGANGKHTIGKDGTLTFRSNAPFSEFVAVLVDGVKVDRSNYDVSEGSTIVRLKQSFLDTLSKGSHTIAIQSIGGTAVTNFSVTASSNSGNTGSAATPTPSTPTAGITNVQPNGGAQAAQKTTVNAKAPVTGEASPVSCVVLALIIVGGFALLIAELRRSRQMQKKH